MKGNQMFSSHRTDYDEKCEQWQKDRTEAESFPLKVGDILSTWDGKPTKTAITDRGNSMIRIGFGDSIYHPDEGWRPTGRTILPSLQYGLVTFLNEKVTEVTEIEITKIYENGNSVQAIVRK